MPILLSFSPCAAWTAVVLGAPAPVLAVAARPIWTVGAAVVPTVLHGVQELALIPLGAPVPRARVEELARDRATVRCVLAVAIAVVVAGGFSVSTFSASS